MMRKKLVRGMLASLCAIAMLTGTAMHPMAASETNKDLDADGMIIDDDLDILRNVLVGSLSTDSCDITGDGTVDVKDVVRLKKIIVESSESDSLYLNTEGDDIQWREMY